MKIENHALALQINEIAKQYVVYAQFSTDMVCHYIGLTKLSELYQFQDARANTAWREMTSTNPQILTTVLFVNPDLATANNLRFDQIRLFKPYCNVHGHTMTSSHYVKCRVRCNETGEIHANASEAAKLMNVAPSYMYSHLKRTHGYKSIKGYTFTRIDEKGNEL
jgi:hypothetical protein